MAHAGPVPTRLVPLSALGQRNVGEKVRFLGCVSNYNTRTGFVTLCHDYPARNRHKAFVDVKLLLETLKSSDTRVGEWVNVLGYVSKQVTASGGETSHSTDVQAIVYWSAGSLQLKEYESILDLDQKPYP